MYSFSTTKKMFATAALIASFSISAQTPQPTDSINENDTVSTQIMSSKVDKDLANNSIDESNGVDTQICPEQFYQVKLPKNGKLCQVFAADLPASMIFFVPQIPQDVIAFYKQDTATFSSTKQVKDRVLLQSEDKNTTLIISSDGKGTQVDVLVKSSNT